MSEVATPSAVLTQREVECDPEQDGITHINVYTKGKTELGRLLTNPSDIGVALPDVGAFACVESLWYWLSTGGKYETLRTARGLKPKILARDQKMKKAYVSGFEEIIKYAIALKIHRHEGLKALLWDPQYAELPFLHYYTYGHPGALVVRPANTSLWTVDFMSEVRKQGPEELANYIQDQYRVVSGRLRAFLQQRDGK